MRDFSPKEALGSKEISAQMPCGEELTLTTHCIELSHTYFNGVLCSVQYVIFLKNDSNL